MFNMLVDKLTVHFKDQKMLSDFTDLNFPFFLSEP